MNNKVLFADGIYYNTPHQKAPVFVLGSLSINKKKFLNFLNNTEANEKGYINLDILNSRKNKPYIKLNEYIKTIDNNQNNNQDIAQEEQLPTINLDEEGPDTQSEVKVEDVPF